ncbi:MAG: sulfite exporter TauE/SafE family protein [Desulfobacterales bacterium]|nr:sulfite exporter TauE/SafE family protein [Desulfobacterales bacterium]
MPIEILILWLWVWIVTFLSTLVRATLGFGNALVAMPLLALILPIQIVTPLVALLAFIISLLILLKDWRLANFRTSGWLTFFSLLGIPVGLLLLKGAYDAEVKVFLALIVIGFSLYNLVDPARLSLKSDRSAFVFGFFAGILGSAYNTHGPPIVIYGTLRKWSPESFRATMQSYFLATGVLIISAHGMAGLITEEVFRYFLVSLPAAALAVVCGNRLNRSIPAGKFDRYVHWGLVCVGIMLLVRTLGR